MNNKQYRLQELINPTTGRSLIVDTSNGLSLGPLPSLEQFSEAVSSILPWADGVVTSPGQSRFLVTRTRKDAALLVSGDWTNALRGANFVLPPKHISYLPLLRASDALDLGANALVIHFLLGHEETIDAQCMQQVVELAIEGMAVGMPLIVDVHPVGPRVVLRPKAIELGISYALEGGADGIAIPWPGESSFASIKTMAAEVPVWIKTESMLPGGTGSLTASTAIVEMLELGVNGLWLDESLFALDNPIAAIQKLHALLHAPVEV